MIQNVKFGAYYVLLPQSDASKRAFDRTFPDPQTAAQFCSAQLQQPLFREFGGRALHIDLQSRKILINTKTNTGSPAADGLDDAQALNLVARQLDDSLETSSTDSSCVLGVVNFITQCFKDTGKQTAEKSNNSIIFF